MRERMRRFSEIALVSAVVSGVTAAVVSRCAVREGSHDVTTRFDNVDDAAGVTTTTQAELPAAPPRAAEPHVLAQPAPVPPDAAPPDAAGRDERDAGEIDAAPPPEPVPADAGEVAVEATDAAATAATPTDAGASLAELFRGPSFAAGAGRFLTEPTPWSASAFEPNPEAGAGTFSTEAPAWGASAFVSNPEAGAGDFTTERNTLGQPALLPPIFFFLQGP
jgi:hypothetical protein